MSGKFGLGKGLADLRAEMGQIPDISILTNVERVVVKQIPIAQIGANPDQPRKTFTETGVLQPILLRTVTGRPYMYEIVAGERRYRASKMAGLSEIPALVKTLNDENAMEIALIENVQRENLNPIEEAAAYQNIMEKCGYELSDVSRLIGKSESYIRNIMRLNTLEDSVKAMVERGELSASAARTIAVAENQEELAHKIINEKLPVAQVANIVKQGPRATKSRAYVSKTIDDDTRGELEAQLKSALGVAAKLVERRGGAGQIVLPFATRVQMQELIDKICK